MTTMTTEPKPPRKPRQVMQPTDDPPDGFEAEGDDEEDGDDGDGGLEEVSDPSLTPKTAAERIDQTRKVATEVNNLLSEFNYSTEQYSCVLRRTKPAFDENGTDITGWTWEGAEPLPENEIEAQFGGGAFQWMIYGPDPRKDGKKGLLRNTHFKVAGKPKPKHRPEVEKNASAAIIEKALDAKEKDTQRLMTTLGDEIKRRDAELAELRKAILKGDGGVSELLKFQEAQRKADLEERKLEMARLETQRKEELAAAEKRENERRIAEEKRETERKAAEEKREAERKAELASSGNNMMQFMQVLMTQTQAQMAQSQANFDNTMKLMTAQADARLNASAEAAQAQVAVMTQMMTMMQAHSQQLVTMASQKTEDPMSGIMQKVVAEAVMEKFSGGGKPEGGFWAGAKDFVKDGLPGIIREAAPLFRGPAAAAPAPKPAGMKPGTVAVVDMAPQAPRREIPRRASPPPAPAAPVAPAAAPAAPGAPAAPAADGAVAVPVAQVQVVEFTPALPGPDVSTEDTFKLLGLNLEGALRASWPAKKIWDEIVMKFPETIRLFLRSMTSKEILAEIEKHAPPESVLVSPRGVKLVNDLEMYLKF